MLRNDPHPARRDQLQLFAGVVGALAAFGTINRVNGQAQRIQTAAILAQRKMSEIELQADQLPYVRWDESGEWVAVWVADPQDPEIGQLTLYRVDRERDRLETVDGAPVDVPALPGFSIGDGRLAWATPRGQGGEGSRIQIAAWTPTGVGIVESAPGEDPIVIR